MALIYPQNGDLTKLLKSARKKVPQSARLSAGGGVQKLKGQCPNAPSMNLRGASLTPKDVVSESPTMTKDPSWLWKLDQKMLVKKDMLMTLSQM